MKQADLSGDKTQNLGGVRIKTIRVSPQELIQTDYFYPKKHFFLVMRPAVKGVDIIASASQNRDLIEQNRLKHGAILFRNLNVKNVIFF